VAVHSMTRREAWSATPEFRICSAMPRVRQSRDHGRLLRSTSVNVAFRIWRAILLGLSAMIVAASFPALVCGRGREGHTCGHGTLMD